MNQRHDLVVIGAGVVGAACAYFASRAGLDVLVLDRGPVAGGTSSRGEGNLLVSDKEAGPELDLAKLSQSVWRGPLAEFGHLWEFHDKGGVVVASSEGAARSLRALSAEQRDRGVRAVDIDAADLPEYEPYLSPELVGGTYYPDDAQVQPMLAAAHLLRLTRERGATVRTGAEVTGISKDGDRVTGVHTSDGGIDAPAVLNAAGTWASSIAAMAGVDVPVLPRRGFVLVTEPLPVTVRHKVYAAEYVQDVASSDSGLQTSPVIEGTDGGTILIGSSRERVGFDDTVSVPVLRSLATKAIEIFPALAGVAVMRHYHGFRPYCPDHLPVIGPDPRAPGLWHACGHEGAGVGLAAGTGALIAQALTGEATSLDLAPFAPERFEAASIGSERAT
ncbi:MAG: NAD(P)/FAD-dependent oxidoreductase [Nocardioidaceae bacterium]